MSEIRDKVKEEIAELLWTRGKPNTRFHSLKYATTPYWKGTIEAYMELVEKILSIKALAIVDREAELPEYTRGVDVVENYTRAVAKETQQDMVKAGWVREVK